MEKPTSEKTWSDLPADRVDHFYRLGDERAQRYGQLAVSAWMEWAKYLFAANTGAATGLFFLSRSSDYRYWYLTAFFCFCGGVFFVGVSFLAFASHCHDVAEGWARDYNAVGESKLKFGELDNKHHARHRSWKWKLTRSGLVISFLLLIAGGLVAAKAFWFDPGAPKQPTPAVTVAAPAKR